jgi:hypothetical protein
MLADATRVQILWALSTLVHANPPHPAAPPP